MPGSYPVASQLLEVFDDGAACFIHFWCQDLHRLALPTARPPLIFLENPRILLENPRIFLENLKIFQENPRIFLENPKIFSENPKNF